ncbi:MAG: molecular chaperone Tir [Symploca sp. SIO2E6]|nr:molecular chaperone Tir [Symploca sp. SIO2E6]
MSRSLRSLKVDPNYIPQVKSAVKEKGYPRQQDFADELGMSLSTVSTYLNGGPVDYLNFVEISQRLGLDGKVISGFVSSIYIERPPIESLCYQEILKPGSLIRIKAPNFMGKTSLMAWIRDRAREHNYRTAYLNLHSAGKTDFTNPNHFLRWFCLNVSNSMELDNRITDYWDEQMYSSKVNSTDYFQEYLLAQANTPLLLCLDGVERVFLCLEVAPTFFELLRYWHELARSNPIWERLRLVVAHSREAYIPLNIDKSPFNVGLPIELPEFTSQQVQELIQRHGLSWTCEQVQRLMDMVGGGCPYRIEQAILNLKNNSIRV